MSEVIAKPMKRVLISRKLGFVVGIVGAVILIGVMAWSEQRHNNSKANKAKEESEKAALALAETPVNESIDAMLQTQKMEAERAKAETKEQDPVAAELEAELNKDLSRHTTTVSSEPTREDLAKAKEEELAMSAYGSEMVALKKGNSLGAMASGINDMVNGGSSPRDERTIPAEDRALVRDAQSQAAAATPNGRNLSFLSNVTGRQGETRVEQGRAERVLHEGSIIPAVVARGINSELPGQVELRTTRDVYDSVNAKVLVVPRGTRAIGAYSADVNTGQNRVLVTFHRLIFPDGRTVYLGNAQGADREGASGFSDKVNTHYWKMVGSSVLLAAIARGAESGGGNSSTNISIGNASGSSSTSPGQIMVDTSRTVLGRYTNLPPTIEIRPGTQVNIIVNKDIVL